MKNFLFVALFISFQMTAMAQNKPKLLYFADPMCSWCYGFSPQFSQVVDSLDGQVDVQLVMGGLRPYGTETMADLGDFLREHWEDVHQRSGQPFRYDILSDQDFVYDTEPACRAVVTMRYLVLDVQFVFFKAIQRAFYVENQNMHDPEVYASLATQFGLDGQVFLEKYNSEKMREAVRQDFALSQKFGVRGFPTTVLQVGDEFYLLSNGYSTAADILQKTTAVLAGQKN